MSEPRSNDESGDRRIAVGGLGALPAGAERDSGVFLLPQLVSGSRGGLVGGYVNSAINVLEELQWSRDITLVAGVAQTDAWWRAGLPDRLPGVRFVGLPMGSRPTSSRYFAEFALRATRAMEKRAGYEYVYGHSGHAAYAAVTAVAARAAAALSVHSIYCPLSDEFQHRRVGTAQRLIARRGLASLDSAIAISENVASSIRLVTGSDRAIAVIPPAVSESLFGADPDISTVAPTDRDFVLGFVGHHRPEKGLDLALSAAARLRRSRANLRLLLVVSGAESRDAAHEITELIVDHGVSDIVQVVRGIEEMREFYGQIDLLLVPFRNTTGPSDYPMVLLEALALGVPAVCTPVGAIPEVVRDGWNGFIAARTDAGSFSDALLRGAEATPSQRGELSVHARESAEAFRAAAVATRTEAHLANLKRRVR